VRTAISPGGRRPGQTAEAIESFLVYDLFVPAFDVNDALRKHLQRNLGEEPGHQPLVDRSNDGNVDRVSTARQDGIGKNLILPLIAPTERKIRAVQPYMRRHARARDQAGHRRRQTAFVWNPLARTGMTKPGGLQQWPLDLASEIVVAGITDRAAGKDMLDISKGLRNDMLYTPTFG
jgi:hypothetical protein